MAVNSRIGSTLFQHPLGRARAPVLVVNAESLAPVVRHLPSIGWHAAPASLGSPWRQKPAADSTAAVAPPPSTVPANLPVESGWGPYALALGERLPRPGLLLSSRPDPPPAAGPPPPVAMPRQPRGMPQVQVHPSRVRGISLSERSVSLMPSLDNLIGELRASNLYVRPANQIGHAPHVTAHPQDSATLTNYGLVTSAGIYAPPQDLYLTSYTDGTSSQLVVSRTVNGLSMGSSVQVADGIATGVCNTNVQLGSQLLNTGVQVQLWKDKARLGFAVLDTNLHTNTWMGGGGFIGIYPNARITDLGEYVGPDAEELAEAHGIDFASEGLHRIELRRSANYTLSLRGGAGMFWLAGLLRVDATRGQGVVYRTMTSTRQTRALVFEGSGLKQYFRDRLRALGLKPEVITIPDPHKPEDLKLGDEVILTKTGSWIIDVLVGNLTMWAGLQIIFRGDVEVSSHRLDATHYEVVFNPTRIRDTGGYLFSPFGPELDFGGGTATAYRQAYIFDIAKPEALQAYHEALDGKLPTLRFRFEPDEATYEGDLQLAALVRDQNAEMPPGVQRLYVHAITTEEARSGFGAHFGLVPKDFLPHGWTNTWATHRTLSRERQSITNGDIIDYGKAITTEDRRELLWHGVSSDEVSAQQRWRQDNDIPRHFEGLTLEATLLRTCARGRRYNYNVIALINRHLGTVLPAFTRAGDKQRREVDIRRVFNAQEIACLERYAALWNPGAAQLKPLEEARLWIQLTQVVHLAKVSLGNVGTLLQAVNQATTIKNKGDAIQKFVQEHGLRAFGLLQRLLPETDGSRLQITSISSSYIDALRTAAQLHLYFLDPIQQDSSACLAERLQKVEKGLAKLRRALLDLEDDPLMSPLEQPLLRDALHSAQSRLYHLVDVQDADRPALVAKFDQAVWSPNARTWDRRRFLQETLALAQAGAQLASQFAAAPMPTHAEGLRQRWNAVYPTAMALHERLLWLSREPLLLAPEVREAHMTAVSRSLDRLVSLQSGFPGSPPRGVLDLSAYSAVQRRVLLQGGGYHTFASPAERHLVRCLRALQ